MMLIKCLSTIEIEVGVMCVHICSLGYAAIPHPFHHAVLLHEDSF